MSDTVFLAAASVFGAAALVPYLRAAYLMERDDRDQEFDAAMRWAMLLLLASVVSLVPLMVLRIIGATV